jgi:hypothetical protein
MRAKRASLVGAAIAIVLITTPCVTYAYEAESSSDGDGSGPATQLTTQQMASHPGAKWFAANKDGEIIGSEDQHLMPAPARRAAGVAAPYLIDDPAAWNACFIQHDQTYRLASYTYYGTGNPMVIKLECGYHNSSNDTGFGWWHISGGHESQWRGRITQVNGDTTGAGWDDLMSFANETNLGWPFTDVPRGSNNTRCVSAPIMTYNNKGEWQYTFTPSIVFATDNKRIITSIPSTNNAC